jgi:glucose/arabinose dehydrogenase
MMRGVRRAAALVVLALAAAPASARAATVTLAKVGDFTAPVYVAAPAGDATRVFVVQRGGSIALVKNGVVSTFADLTSSVLSGDERGLLSMAFAPDYATSGLFYVYYTARSPTGQITIAELRRDPANPDRADPGYSRVLLTIPHDQQSNHNGGQLQVGRDGFLYAGIGDGGSGGDPSGNAQDVTPAPPTVVGGVNHDYRLGKILRLDRSTGAFTIFSYGLRNPWRFSFDRLTGDLVIGDVGQDAVEEIDFARKGTARGANYGWRPWEGRSRNFNEPAPGAKFPVITQTHADGWCSITGGYVVRDRAVPGLYGRYVYSDYCKGEIRSARLSAGRATDDRKVAGLSTVSGLDSFGEDAAGRVYVVSQEGSVYRFAAR